MTRHATTLTPIHNNNLFTEIQLHISHTIAPCIHFMHKSKINYSTSFFLFNNHRSHSFLIFHDNPSSPMKPIFYYSALNIFSLSITPPPVLIYESLLLYSVAALVYQITLHKYTLSHTKFRRRTRVPLPNHKIPTPHSKRKMGRVP